MTHVIGVAEAKRRFSELIERVRSGERFVVTRRGRPVLALVPPAELADEEPRFLGLAALAGALADWDELDDVVAEIYASRRRAKDRDVPDLD
jgi:prevent-host-death family protein